MSKHEWWANKTDPYDTLIQLVEFAEAADKHITNHNNNFKVVSNQHNLLKQDYEQMKHRIVALEAVVNEFLEVINGTRKKD